MKNAESPAVTDRILKEHDFDSHFSFDIRPHIRVTEYEKGEYIIRNTDQLTRILYLVQGTAKLYGFHKNGRQSLINFFTPFSLFGVPELFEENKRPYPWWHRQSAALSKLIRGVAVPAFFRMHGF